MVRQAERWRDKLKTLDRSWARIELRHRSDDAYSGRAWDTRVVLSIGRVRAAEMYAIILHELAHTVCRDHHGREWRRTYLRAARDAFPGIQLDRSIKGTKYVLDSRIADAIDAHLASGGSIKYHVRAG